MNGEDEEDPPPLPPPGRRATRSGLGKDDGSVGPSPLGERAKSEGAQPGSGGGSRSAGRHERAAAAAAAELAWLQAGKNLLDFGGDVGVKQEAPAAASGAAATSSDGAGPAPSAAGAEPAAGRASPMQPRPLVGAAAASAAAAAARIQAGLPRGASKQPVSQPVGSGAAAAAASSQPSSSAAAAAGGSPAGAAAGDAAAAAAAARAGGAAGADASGAASAAARSASQRQRQPRQHARSAVAQLQEAARPSAASGAGPSAAPEASPAESQPQPATWAIKQWRKLAEPQRNKTHWDYLLEEMEWLSKDFKQEAAWKAALARKAVKAVSRWHAERAQLESKTHRSEEAQTRRLASAICREVLDVWSQVARVAEYKHNQRVEAARLETRNKQLDFLVGQTARYTSMLTEGLTGGGEEEGEEGEGDERRRASVEKVDRIAELQRLQQEAEAPIDEELLRAFEEEGEEEEEEDDDEFATSGEEEEVDEDEGGGDAEEAEAAAEAAEEAAPPAEEEGGDGAAAAAVAAPAPEDVEMADAPGASSDAAEALASSAEAAGPGDAAAADDDAAASEEAAAGAAAGGSEGGGAAASGGGGGADADGGDEPEDPAEDIDLEAEAAAASHAGKSNRERMESTMAEAAELRPTGDTLATANVKVQVPFLIRGTLREYQHVALDWMVSMYDKNLNGILADEMGLGKTLMTISMLAWLACERGIWGPHLVVVPTSVMLNWEMEIKKFCPAFKILTYYGTQKERKLKRQGWSKTNAFHVCITSYKLVIQDQAAFRRKKWKYLILDEARRA